MAKNASSLLISTLLKYKPNNYNKTYVGETGSTFRVRLEKHIKNTKRQEQEIYTEVLVMLVEKLDGGSA